MTRFMREPLALTLLLVASSAALAGVPIDPTIWSGPDVEFDRAAHVDPLLPENQDRLTDNVWLSRNGSEGLYNAATECEEFSCTYTHNFSPEGTLWATSEVSENYELTIEANNWEALTFTDWESAYGAGGSLSTFILELPAVVHLTTENIYLDLMFTSWGQGFGGGGRFAYIRSSPAPIVVTTGDYNGNGVVDAADYTVWRDTLGQTVAMAGDGADGTGPGGMPDGLVDQLDYQFWKDRFGNVVPGAGGGSAGGLAASVAVPEPGTLAVAMIVLLTVSSAAVYRNGTRR
jgi:hypothetical protein